MAEIMIREQKQHHHNISLWSLITLYVYYETIKYDCPKLNVALVSNIMLLECLFHNS